MNYVNGNFGRIEYVQNEFRNEKYLYRLISKIQQRLILIGNTMFGIKTKVKKKWHEYMVDHRPRKVIDKIWMCNYGYKVDWNNPKNLNEKIEWLICYGDTSMWPILADKYKVRNWIKEKGYANLLTKIYGVWDDASIIDFDRLPDKFVLKCNHDSGSCYLIDKSRGFDKKRIVKDTNAHLRQKFGYRLCEPHYNKINPKVIAEEYLENDAPFSASLVDYKVWCFDGKPYCIFVAFSRTHEHIYTNVYDLNWQVHPEWSVFSDHYMDGGGVVPRPIVLDEMLKVASDLSKGFPEVRVDFYMVRDRLVFGEMTFTSDCGRMGYFTKEFLLELGNQIVLPDRKGSFGFEI